VRRFFGYTDGEIYALVSELFVLEREQDTARRHHRSRSHIGARVDDVTDRLCDQQAVTKVGSAAQLRFLIGSLSATRLTEDQRRKLAWSAIYLLEADYRCRREGVSLFETVDLGAPAASVAAEGGAS